MALSEKNMGGNVRKICEDETCTVYQLREEHGEGHMTVYQVFKGCYLLYNDFHMAHCTSGFQADNGAQMLCIDHCREGRIEWGIAQNRYMYIEAGDMQINNRAYHCGLFSFPLKHYHGITIGFDVEEAEEGLLHIMDGFSVDLRKLRQKYCPNDQCFVMRAGKRIDHIFSELYDIPEHIRVPYFKIKILELLLFLDVFEIPESADERPYFYKTQVDKVKDIVTLMTGDLEHWYTLEELSEQFSFPLTSLKQCFKGVYGCSIAAYMKDYRMNAAAMMLKSSDESIVTIASKVGYDNPGKFAAAFRTVLGMTPSEYRKETTQ